MSLHCNRRTQLLLLTGLILLVLLVAFLAGRLIPDSAVAADRGTPLATTYRRTDISYSRPG